MPARNTARRVVPLGDAIRGATKLRAKKPVPSFPKADQIEQVRKNLWALVGAGKAEKVEGELKQLLNALSIDPVSPDAWRDATLLLACLYCGVGTAPKTNKNAKKLTAAHELALLREMTRLEAQGLNQAQAFRVLAGNRKTAALLKLSGSRIQGVRTLKQRLARIRKARVGWEALIGNPSMSAIEMTLICLCFVRDGDKRTGT